MLESQNEHSWSYTVFMLKFCCYVHYFYELVHIVSEQSHYALMCSTNLFTATVIIFKDGYQRVLNATWTAENLSIDTRLNKCRSGDGTNGKCDSQISNTHLGLYA